ncbi:glycosyltransferase [Candidatus Pelagibacter sp.]|nr:glycosyltransferase [Candidatus Pelagibacter sp.]
MKISIITVTYNSQLTIRDTINSVISQTHKNIEHIIVDGGSNDGTKKIINNYKNKKNKVFHKPGLGIYAAINYGIKHSSGKFISVLNSDDFYNSPDTIEKIVKIFKRNPKTKIFLGDVVYFNNSEYFNPIRSYLVKHFRTWHMLCGLMPPHPSSIISKSIYDKYGGYYEKFKIASDFDFFLRIIYIKKIKYKKINDVIVRMRSGGVSDKGVYSYIRNTYEVYQSFLNNKVNTSLILISLRFIFKINQLFIRNKKKLNKSFKVFKITFDRKFLLANNFKIVTNYNNILHKKKLILAAMNLAFLGYFSVGKLYTHINLYNWVDGVWAEKLANISKTPGRELIKHLKIPKEIKVLSVIGNLSNLSKKYLSKKFNLKIVNIKLPYGDIETIIKTKIKIPKNSLTLITLPTPKQEQLAYHIAKQNKNFRIICIGASIALSSGEEIKVPDFLNRIEFLWRLKNDTRRRLIRLFESLFYYIYGKYKTKKITNILFIKYD